MQLRKNLAGPRITIRDYRKSDLPSVTAMWFDEENGRYMSDPTAEYVDEKYQAALDALEDNPDGYYLTVVLNASGAIMGTACIFPEEPEGRFDIGYCIHRDCWRQGYGTELIGLIIDWVRENGGREITAEVAKENTGSNMLLRKNGFEVLREGKFKKYNMGIDFESHVYRLALGRHSA